MQATDLQGWLVANENQVSGAQALKITKYHKLPHEQDAPPAVRAVPRALIRTPPCWPLILPDGNLASYLAGAPVSPS